MLPDNLKPFHVFIIDDDVDDQDLLIEAFTEIDKTIQFSIAADGREGMNYLIKDVVQKPDPYHC